MQAEHYAPRPLCTTEEATAIMRQNFHGVGAAQRHFGAELSAKQAKALATVPFSAEVLQACRESHVLVAGAPLSIMDLQAKAQASFYFKDDPWYAKDRFATTKVKAGWYLIRKDPVPGSPSKTWAEQQALLTSDEVTPRAREIVLAIVLCYLETEERLFGQVDVRTNDVHSGGRHVYVGHFDSHGLGVNSYWVGHRYGNLGLAASQKFS
jgi:hypothetical protein